MKYFVLAVFLNCKNARVIFIFQNGFENWILNVFGNWIVWIKFWNLSFFTIFEKKLFKVSAVSDSDVSIFSFSVRFIFSLNTDLSESRFYCFPKFLIILFLTFFFIQILVIFFFCLFQERHSFIPLFYIKLTGFFCFLS